MPIRICRSVTFLLLLALPFMPAHAESIAPSVIKNTELKAGAVASPDRYGAEVAAAVLQQGGNAVDAAVATAFALAVTYPEAGNIGGGGFMTLWFDGKAYFLDYREMAPAKAHRDMYLNSEGDVIDGLSLIGHQASGVRCPRHRNGTLASASTLWYQTLGRINCPGHSIGQRGLYRTRQTLPV